MNRSYKKFSLTLQHVISAKFKEMVKKNQEFCKIISLTLKNSYASIHRHMGTL